MEARSHDSPSGAWHMPPLVSPAARTGCSVAASNLAAGGFHIPFKPCSIARCAAGQEFCSLVCGAKLLPCGKLVSLLQCAIEPSSTDAGLGLVSYCVTFLCTDAAAGAGSNSNRGLARLRLVPGHQSAQQQEQGRLLGEDVAGSAPDNASPCVALEAVALSETWLVFEQTMREVRVALPQQQQYTAFYQKSCTGLYGKRKAMSMTVTRSLR